VEGGKKTVQRIVVETRKRWYGFWSIGSWSSAGPLTATPSFLLAVTAPRVPSISPIPVQNTVAGPLFSVAVLRGFFGVWRDDVRESSECRETVDVLNGSL